MPRPSVATFDGLINYAQKLAMQARARDRARVSARAKVRGKAKVRVMGPGLRPELGL